MIGEWSHGLPPGDDDNKLADQKVNPFSLLDDPGVPHWFKSVYIVLEPVLDRLERALGGDPEANARSSDREP